VYSLSDIIRHQDTKTQCCV